MVSWADVKAGRINLAEIVRLNDYLDMISDFEYFAMKDAEKNQKTPRRGGRR